MQCRRYLQQLSNPILNRTMAGSAQPDPNRKNSVSETETVADRSLVLDVFISPSVQISDPPRSSRTVFDPLQSLPVRVILAELYRDRAALGVRAPSVSVVVKRRRGSA